MKNTTSIFPNPDLLAQVIVNQRVRTEVAEKSHLMFFYIYFAQYVTYKMAPFHNELFAITHDTTSPLSIIVGFRGSGKTTILSESYPIWAILGEQQKKFILIVCKTTEQAKQKLKNIKLELDSNTLLQQDLGPFTEEQEEWNATSLVLDKFGAKITAVSSEQSIRGIKYKGIRPDLVILDDVEDQDSVRSVESREKLANWISGEIMPIGDLNTKFVMLGNALHPESLLMRYGGMIKSKQIVGTFKMYPIVDKNGTPLWLGKYPTKDHVERERSLIADEITWQREYMLNPIANKVQIIDKSWIHYYQEIPPLSSDEYITTLISVDPAISQHAQADYTAIVAAHVFSHGDELKIYILPNPINTRLTNPQLIDTIKSVSEMLSQGRKYEILIEKVGYQTAIAQQLAEEGYPAIAIPVGRMTKADRLKLTSYAMQSGKVMFPKGDNILVRSILNFGNTKHDDIVDAFTQLVNHIKDEKKKKANDYLVPLYT